MFVLFGQKMGQRPTLPQLKLKYHWRVFVSRPSSEWDRVGPKSYNRQTIYILKIFNDTRDAFLRLHIRIV